MLPNLARYAASATTKLRIASKDRCADIVAFLLQRRKFHVPFSRSAAGCAALCLGALSGCGGDSGTATVQPLTCDDSLKTTFTPTALSAAATTQVLFVKQFKKGDSIILSGTATTTTPVAANDICLVKLIVGPANPGPAGAPSTTSGIGIEVWLPTAANWNGRLEALGGSGWAGGVQTSLTGFATSSVGNPWDIAGTNGSVASTTDTGHPAANGSFLMNADGTVNTLGWQQFSDSGIHEMTVKAKALAQGFFGSAPKYSYWRGNSTGGRQGLKQAQNYPNDFDGIIANRPAIYWAQTTYTQMYPAIVAQRDLGGTVLTSAQLSLVSLAAIGQCDLVGGQHLGYVLDPPSCKYDPTTDASVLCTSSGGANATAACVTTAQANAINKFWYGPTANGSVPSPATDNGSAAIPGSPKWWGYPRGADLSFVAAATPFSVGSDTVALELQNPTIATPTFINATGNGLNLWTSLSYGQLSNAEDRGVQLDTLFGSINTDNTDLSAVKAHGTKMISVHGQSDNLIPYQGTVYYYNQVVAKMGGLSPTQDFWRLYLIPGAGHVFPNGTANPNANPPAYNDATLFQILRTWVENGTAPGRIDISNTPTAALPTAKSRPICVYPLKATYGGSGDINVAASYTCS